MANTLTSQVKHLLDRLNTAEQQASALQIEIKDIKSEINTLRDAASMMIDADDLLNCSTFSAKRRKSDSTDSPMSDAGLSKRPKGNLPKENDYVVVYTDGACENNGKTKARAGIGVWFGDDHSLNISKPVQGRATNNTAEIQAACAALKLINELGHKKVKLYTDSEFTINCITKWMKNWKRNGWKLSSGGMVKNKEDLVILDNLCQKFEHVDWKHCRGHAGVKGNEEADKLARCGAQRYKAPL